MGVVEPSARDGSPDPLPQDLQCLGAHSVRAQPRDTQPGPLSEPQRHGGSGSASPRTRAWKQRSICAQAAVLLLLLLPLPLTESLLPVRVLQRRSRPSHNPLRLSLPHRRLGLAVLLPASLVERKIMKDIYKLIIIIIDIHDFRFLSYFYKSPHKSLINSQELATR